MNPGDTRHWNISQKIETPTNCWVTNNRVDLITSRRTFKDALTRLTQSHWHQQNACFDVTQYRIVGGQQDDTRQPY